MSIVITESAAKHIANQVAKAGGIGLRLGVRKGGCTGLSYVFDIAQQVETDDTVFEQFGSKVLVDAASLPLLAGSEVDYVRQGLGQAFKVKNPNVAASCGCGSSFSVTGS